MLACKSYVRHFIENISNRFHNGVITGEHPRNRRYPEVNPMHYLQPGQHMRIRGCFCTWGHIDQGLLGMADEILQAGRSLVCLEETNWIGHQFNLFSRCFAYHRQDDFRLVNVFPSDNAFELSHTLPLQVGKHKWSHMADYCPDVLSANPDVDLTGSRGEQVVLQCMPAKFHGDIGEYLLSETLAFLESSAVERCKRDLNPFVVFLNFVAEDATSELLSRFLQRMREIKVSVVVSERIHFKNCTEIPVTEVDSLFALDLGGACWTTVDNTFPVKTKADSDRWNHSAFLVRGEQKSLMGSYPQEIRLPYVCSPYCLQSDQESSILEHAVLQWRNGMRQVQTHLKALS